MVDAPTELGDTLSGSMSIKNEYSGATLLGNSKYRNPSLRKPPSWPVQPFHGKSFQDFQPLAASAQAGFCCAPKGGEMRTNGIAQTAYKLLFPNCPVYRLSFPTTRLSQRHHTASWHPGPRSRILLMDCEPNICGKHCATSKTVVKTIHPQLNRKCRHLRTKL